MVFFSNPPYSGNARALYEHLRAGAPDLRVTWLVADRADGERLADRGVPAAHHRSARGVLAQARATALVTTHGFLAARYFRRLPVVSLWHGMSPKGVGLTRGNSSRRELRRKARFGARVDLATASSMNMAHVLAAAHGIDPRRIAVTGHPRNDWLVRGHDPALDRLVGPERVGGPVALYAPTTRRDGAGGAADPVGVVLRSDAVARAVDGAGATLLVKPHPYDEAAVAGADGTGPVRPLTTVDLEREGVDLYQVLGGVDVLVTDYSSVYLDFLLLDRPVLFFSPDLDAFQTSRGFKLEPLELWMPGPRYATADELARGLAAALAGEDGHGEGRGVVRGLVHRHTDDRACERTWAAVRELTGT